MERARRREFLTPARARARALFWPNCQKQALAGDVEHG